MDAPAALDRPLLSKPCSRCKLTKSLPEFHNDASKPSGKRPECKACASTGFAKYQAANPDAWWAPRMLSKFGITADRYAELVAGQRGACAICKRPDPRGFRLSVDHDHVCCPGKKSCGKCVRGLLCGNCNAAIGLLQDDPDMLEQAAQYLRHFRP